MSEGYVLTLAVVAIVALCFVAFVAIVSLLFYFSDKRIKAGWTTKAEAKNVKAVSDVNIEALNPKEKIDRSFSILSIS